MPLLSLASPDATGFAERSSAETCSGLPDASAVKLADSTASGSNAVATSGRASADFAEAEEALDDAEAAIRSAEAAFVRAACAFGRALWFATFGRGRA